MDQVFRIELPRQGNTCSIMDGEPLVSSSLTWNTYNFTCDYDDPLHPLVFDGRAAEVRVGDLFYSILVFQP